MSSQDPFGPLEYELKFEVDRFRTEAIACHLDRLCQPDPQHPANTVVSIYFDTPDLRLLREKWDSHYLKTKVRLRWYEDLEGPGTSRAFLEVKRRIGSRRRKARVTTRLEGRRLAELPSTAPELLTAVEGLRDAGLHPGGILEPFLAVRYHRRRFVEPLTGARVCLDTDIRGEALRVPSPTLGGFRPRPEALGLLDLSVLEVKGSGSSLPPPLLHLVQAGCFKSSFSKYDLCYQRLADPSI